MRKKKKPDIISAKERYAGACSRSFYVGEDVEQSDIKAEFKHGILTLFVPKKESKTGSRAEKDHCNRRLILSRGRVRKKSSLMKQKGGC